MVRCKKKQSQKSGSREGNEIKRFGRQGRGGRGRNSLGHTDTELHLHEKPQEGKNVLISKKFCQFCRK